MARHDGEKGRRILRIALGAFLALTCLRVWTGSGDWPSRAQAQIPNAGAQRADLLEEVRHTNHLLAEVLTILRTQTIKVAVQAEEAGRPRPGPPAPRASGKVE